MQRDDISPKQWGPPAWEFLDLVAAGYPEVAMMDQQMAITIFLESLGFALPCERCRANFRRFAASKPPGLAKGLRMWLGDLKRDVAGLPP